ncbi:50S ribosomal protein L5 [Candidatus Uhrbacteria bacterium]|jgi:large subunit ribosomal protein L5|nr:50S ribosomal protein L5 [Candidatus Uhrbacteria bacterium]
MAAIKEQYLAAVPKLKEQLKLENVSAVPKIQKVTLNVGLGKGLKDKAYIETVEKTIQRISGQKPVFTKARKSIASFKIREGMPIGLKVTLRGPRMYDFVEKLVNVTFPRVRDFRGISPKSVDSAGNFNYGFKEHIAFPEVSTTEVDRLHGLQVTITTSAKNKEQGRALFDALGFPFIKNQN